MKFSNQSNKILGKDWLNYHPYNNITFVDNYYISLCNSVLDIIQQSEILGFTSNLNGTKALACVLTAYFEDVISETRLFSAFTRQHKKMYGKELPFYEISDEYYDDDINEYDIYFLIWYHLSGYNKKILIDPYFEDSQVFSEVVSEIYNLFDREFEKAPQNEKLKNFLQLSAGSDVKTVREILSFIACKSFLWKSVFEDYFNKVLNDYKEGDVVVLNERTEVEIYDQEIHFIFDECMPLLAMRANEYFAEVLGEKHSEYQFIKNISKRIIGCFLIRKIEKDGFLIEHLSSKKQLWLSNESTSLQKIELVENETVLTICMVQWKKNVWHNQGACMVNTIRDMKGEDLSKHLFNDENEKQEFVRSFEKPFLELANGKLIAYMHENHEYAEFYLDLLRKHPKVVNPQLTDEEWDEKYKNFIKDNENTFSGNNEPIGVFFNSNRGLEMYNENVISCMPDDNNPYYANKTFNLSDLITNEAFSPEFVTYIIENELIRLHLCNYKNPDIFDIIKENLDFLLRFYRRSNYFSKPEVTIQ